MRGRWLVQLAALLGLFSCTAPYWDRRSGQRFTDIDAMATVIKLHLSSGEVYVLSPWHLDSARRVIVGTGDRLSPARDRLQSGVFEIPLDSVAVFESNRRKELISVGVSTTTTLGFVGAAFGAFILLIFFQGNFH